jgi:hypothetical protein
LKGYLIMTGKRHEHSLRNPQIGQAYMMLVDLYEQCQAQGLNTTQIRERIQSEHPWGTGKQWVHRAWDIARREFLADYGLTPGQAPQPRNNCPHD